MKEYIYTVKCECGQKNISGGINVPQNDMTKLSCRECKEYYELVKVEEVNA